MPGQRSRAYSPGRSGAEAGSRCARPRVIRRTAFCRGGTTASRCRAEQRSAPNQHSRSAVGFPTPPSLRKIGSSIPKNRRWTMRGSVSRWIGAACLRRPVLRRHGEVNSPLRGRWYARAALGRAAAPTALWTIRQSPDPSTDGLTDSTPPLDSPLVLRTAVAQRLWSVRQPTDAATALILLGTLKPPPENESHKDQWRQSVNRRTAALRRLFGAVGTQWVG